MEVSITRGIILDTDVLIYFIKKKLLSAIVSKINCFLTFVSLYEYLRGSLYIGKDLDNVKKELEESLIIIFPDNNDIKKLCELWVELRRKGMLINDRDLMIGAIAISKDLPLVTKNLKHFVRLKEYGLKLLDLEQFLDVIQANFVVV